MPINVDKRDPQGFFATTKQLISDVGTIGTNVLGGLVVVTGELAKSSNTFVVEPISLLSTRTESMMNLAKAKVRMACLDEGLEAEATNLFYDTVKDSALYAKDIMGKVRNQYLGDRSIEPELMKKLGLTATETTEEATSNGGNRQSNIANILANEEE